MTYRTAGRPLLEVTVSMVMRIIQTLPFKGVKRRACEPLVRPSMNA
jgi:hypothetical protein